MIGPGKYGDVCQRAKDETNADSVVLIVIEGNKGSGASCKLDPSLAKLVPKLLRKMADQMEKDLEHVPG